MKSKGIKNLLIDLGGVLINLDRERCIENFKKIGFQNIEEKFCTHQLDGIFLQQEKGLITPAEFRDGILPMPSSYTVLCGWKISRNHKNDGQVIKKISQKVLDF